MTFPMAKIVSHYGKRSWETIGKPSGNDEETLWETMTEYICIVILDR
jgi:hypothetical protein